MSETFRTLPLGLFFGPADTGTVTSTANIDTAFVFETSGDAACCKFTAPTSQTAGTLTVYAFVTAVTGSPDFQIEVRGGYTGTGDIDRPATAGSDLATGSSTVSAPSANTWVSWTCTVSLTVGQVYWVLIKNTHGTPASNHATFQYRGSLDTFALGGLTENNMFTGGYTIDGFATDPTLTTAGLSPFVLKFADGDLMGFPYVSTTTHANNANSRGFRLQFPVPVVISGVTGGVISAALSALAIYLSDGTLVYSYTADASQKVRPVFRFPPITLRAYTSYDFVMELSANSTTGTFYTMGQAEGSVPEDVKNCRPANIASVDGATPGSFTVDTSMVQRMLLLIDTFPVWQIGKSLFTGGRM